jgi:hypothetical protein
LRWRRGRSRVDVLTGTPRPRSRRKRPPLHVDGPLSGCPSACVLSRLACVPEQAPHDLAEARRSHRGRLGVGLPEENILPRRPVGARERRGETLRTVLAMSKAPVGPPCLRAERAVKPGALSGIEQEEVDLVGRTRAGRLKGAVLQVFSPRRAVGICHASRARRSPAREGSQKRRDCREHGPAAANDRRLVPALPRALFRRPTGKR